jgi:hypothetical protein
MRNTFTKFGFAIAFIVGIVFVGGIAGSNGSLSVSGQSMIKKVETGVVKGTKKVYNVSKKGVKKGVRVGHRVGDRVWTGTKWVGVNAWKGGTWVAVKTANGTKWVYRKAKRAVYGPPRRVS